MKRYTRAEMAANVTRDIPAGSYVNLGIGMPVDVVASFRPEDEILVHSENGILGMRSLDPGEPIDPDNMNAAKRPVGLIPGGCYFHHADSFAMMRGGHLDYCILGAYEVSHNGDVANWSLGQPGVANAVGGAMDLVVGARNVFVMMEHVTRDGKPRLVEKCSLPLTGSSCVKRIYTDLAIIAVDARGFAVLDMIRGISREQLQELSGAELHFPD